MRLITDADLPLKDGCVLSIGNFDGVHKGHTALIDALTSQAEERELLSLIWTFSEHPQSYLQEKPVKYIISSRDKAELFEKKGVDALYNADFIKFRDLDARAFVSDVICESFGAKHVVCGYDFSFGKGKSGNAEVLRGLLNESGVGLTIVPPVFVGGEAVSSTALRALIKNGDMIRAAAFLGRIYSFELPVVHGMKRGRLIGSPTLNQSFPFDRAVPAYGVYAGFCEFGGAVYESVTNIGVKPTVSDYSGEPICETHLLDFDGDLYDKSVKVYLCSKLRDERRFESLSALSRQIALDISAAREALKGFDKRAL